MEDNPLSSSIETNEPEVSSEQTASAPVTNAEPEKAYIENSFALNVSAKKYAQVENSLVGALVAGQDISVENSFGSAVVAGGNIHLEQGGIGFATVGGAVQAKRTFVGVLLAKSEVKLEEGSKVLMTRQQALAFGAAFGVVFGLLSALLRRKRHK